jgi:hypothetical protein
MLWRKLLGISSSYFRNPGADHPGVNVDQTYCVALLVIFRTAVIRRFLPIVTRNVVFDEPGAVPCNSHGGLVERTAIGSVIDYALAGRARTRGHRCFEVNRISRTGLCS